jgi:hypothetical protein
MRALVGLGLLVAACTPSGVSQAQEICARAAGMFERCEDLGTATKLERELAYDRWRGLCRAVFTGETRQLMPDALAAFEALGESERGALRSQATCASRATTCLAYRACEP